MTTGPIEAKNESGAVANENTIGRETVANWMLLRGYATGHGDTIQDLLFELEGQLGGPKEPPPGQGDFQLLRAENERLRAALQNISSLLPDKRDPLDDGRSALAWDMARIARSAIAKATMTAPASRSGGLS